MEESEIAIEQPLSEEREPGNRPVSIFIVRHLEPTPGYPEEQPLVLEEAIPQARQTAKEILEQCESDEALIFYGAGPKGRHQQSLELLRKAVEEEVRQSDKSIETVELPPTAAKKKSLRPVSLWRFTEVAPKKEMEYWLKTDGRGESEPPKRVAKRLTTLLNGLINFTKRQEAGSRVTWVLITSGECVAAWTKKLSEIGKPVGLEPGRWLRVDVTEGEFSGKANLVHWKEAAREISLSTH